MRRSRRRATTTEHDGEKTTVSAGGGSCGVGTRWRPRGSSSVRLSPRESSHRGHHHHRRATRARGVAARDDKARGVACARRHTHTRQKICAVDARGAERVDVARRAERLARRVPAASRAAKVAARARAQEARFDVGRRAPPAALQLERAEAVGVVSTPPDREGGRARRTREWRARSETGETRGGRQRRSKEEDKGSPARHAPRAGQMGVRGECALSGGRAETSAAWGGDGEEGDGGMKTHVWQFVPSGHSMQEPL